MHRFVAAMGRSGRSRRGARTRAPPRDASFHGFPNLNRPAEQFTVDAVLTSTPRGKAPRRRRPARIPDRKYANCGA
eukprot:8227366-Alexandrium_andersonii.AAC.1